jgi:hypothetical protein
MSCTTNEPWACMGLTRATLGQRRGAHLHKPAITRDYLTVLTSNISYHRLVYAQANGPRWAPLLHRLVRYPCQTMRSTVVTFSAPQP